MVRLVLLLCVSGVWHCTCAHGHHLGSPWGAGAFAGPDGSRQPSALELEIAKQQGIGFWETVSKYKFSSPTTGVAKLFSKLKVAFQ